MPRFVVLEHRQQGVHWDFMLETAGALRTWRLAAAPAIDATIRATPLADHRLIYLEYEGEISGGRGSVTQWDAGEFDWEPSGPSEVAVRLAGRIISGRAYLREVESGDWEFMLTLPESASS